MIFTPARRALIMRQVEQGGALLFLIIACIYLYIFRISAPLQCVSEIYKHPGPDRSRRVANFSPARCSLSDHLLPIFLLYLSLHYGKHQFCLPRLLGTGRYTRVEEVIAQSLLKQELRHIRRGSHWLPRRRQEGQTFFRPPFSHSPLLQILVKQCRIAQDQNVLSNRERMFSVRVTASPVFN